MVGRPTLAEWEREGEVVDGDDLLGVSQSMQHRFSPLINPQMPVDQIQKLRHEPKSVSNPEVVVQTYSFISCDDPNSPVSAHLLLSPASATTGSERSLTSSKTDLVSYSYA